MKLLFTSGADHRSGRSKTFGKRPAAWRGIHNQAERDQRSGQEQDHSHCRIIPLQTVRPALGGNDTRASRHGANSTRADLPYSPSSFLHAAPIDDDVRERAAKTFCTVVISSAFAIPLMLAGIILWFS